MKRFFCFLLSILVVFYGANAGCYKDYSPEEITACFVRAGSYYNVPPVVLWSIAYVESGFNSEAINYNRESHDVGMMQINSRWFSVLRRYGITEEDLYDPCLNIFVGAWILSQCYVKYQTLHDAISCYHTGRKYSESPEGAEYTWKVWRVIQRVLDGENR